MSTTTESVIFNQSFNTPGNAINKMTVKFPSPVQFKNKVLALGYAGLYYSWRNVSSTYNNQNFSYIFTDGNTYPIAVPTGNYGITDLSNYLQLQMQINGHYVLDSNGNKIFFISWVPDVTYYSVLFTCTQTYVPSGGSNPNSITLNKTPQLVFPSGGFSNLLGTNAGIYPSTQTVSGPNYQFQSQKIAQISPVTTININADLVDNKNNICNTCIYQFAPTSPYASFLSIQPTYPIYYKLRDGEYQQMTVSFTDGSNNPLPLIDTTSMTVTLLINDRI